MALEPGGGLPSLSPTSSGRASPAPRNRRLGQRGEEDVYPKDKAFRRYAAGLDRALAQFETAFEDWADYISFLGRLLKSLQAHPPNCTVIPSKSIVAKRLSQCLNPDLPSGVHQKAIEVYAFLFTLIGRDTLSKELPLYLPGLSSTLSFASLTVRTPFLALLETHFLKVDSAALRPALKAIILALLPGLEEETSEDFERTLRILNAFKAAVQIGDDASLVSKSGDEYFWQCFFLASITSTNRRLGALSYLTRCLPKLGGIYPRQSNQTAKTEPADAEMDHNLSRDAAMVTSPEPGLLLRCFAAGLNDDQLLIQRGFLDLLVTHLPLHARVLQTRVKPGDLDLLMTAASAVVARRDMSLNRRLWSWLLGPEPTSGNDGDGIESPISSAADPMNDAASSRTHYFEEFGLQPLTRALLKMISKDQQTTTERARPYRICLSLMDRWEIGGLVVPEIFLPVVNSVRRYESRSPEKSEFKEVLRSASVFFDGVESGLIWGEILGLLAEALGPSKTGLDEKIEKLILVRFILAHFNVREEEMLILHAPVTLVAVLAMIQESRSSNTTVCGKVDSLTKLTIDVANDLVDLVPERAYRAADHISTASDVPTPAKDLKHSEILQKVHRFYVQDQGNLDISEAPFTATQITHLALRGAGELNSQSLNSESSSAEDAAKVRLLVNLLAKTPVTASLQVKDLLSAIASSLRHGAQTSFSTFTSVVSLLINLYEGSYVSIENFSSIIEPLVKTAWHYLSPSYPKYHVETARILWQLQSALSLSNHEIEAALCDQIIGHGEASSIVVGDADSGRRFAILWTHVVVDNASNLERRSSKHLEVETKRTGSASGLGAYEIMLGRPLLMLLDALLDERTQLFVTMRTWLQTLSGIDKLFHLFVAKFANFEFLQTPFVDQSPDDSGAALSDNDDLSQCLYYLQTLSNILRWSSAKTWSALADNSISTDKGYKDLHRITGYDGELSLQEFFVHVCLCSVNGHQFSSADFHVRHQLHRVALTVMHQLFMSPLSSPLAELHLEHKLIELLHKSVESSDPFIQISLLDVVYAALRLNAVKTPIPDPPSPLSMRRLSLQGISNPSKISLKLETPPSFTPPPPALIKCLQAGFSSLNSRPVVDSWMGFLAEVLPLYTDTIFQVLIPLVGTLCSQVSETFESLQATFEGVHTGKASTPESTLISLINGLEQVLARGHERLVKDEAMTSYVKSPDQPQGFFGNMVSGVFASDTPASRSQNANNRLTVLLSFQDAVRISYSIWSWGGVGNEDSKQDVESAASFSYTSLRMRNRARRLLEHLFAAEALECLETIIEIWQKSQVADGSRNTGIFNLLHVLNGSRPKYTMPAIFDAIYSRTNPAVLDQSRKSTLTSELKDTDLVVFLVDYAKSLEDDAMDEIWMDCMTFLKDILTNPLPHRQILPSLLEFASILGEKVDNTNFGEQKKMRRELGDLFLRLLTATFTTKPISFSDPSASTLSLTTEKQAEVEDRGLSRADDIVAILASITPGLLMVLVEPERILSAANTISASVIGPTIRSKAFPDNVTKSTLDLLYQVARLPGTQKAWRKDISDALNDPRFFANSITLVKSNWLPLLKQWSLSDKERMPELLSRLTPPTTAGIVFGVGATSARIEADRKTQLNLRRVATLILAAANDTFVTELAPLEVKIVELLAATNTSSPSSTTRAEIYMVLRALALRISPIHLAPFWPTVNAELHASISSIISADYSSSFDTYNNQSVLQACKLLDVLLCINPDDFQLHEWLYITDTIDAVYRPAYYTPSGLIDELAEELGSTMHISSAYTEHMTLAGSTNKSMRQPLLGSGGIDCEQINMERRDELIGKVLRPFFSQLSIFAFERTYEMGDVDWDLLTSGLLVDLFDERGIVKAL